MDYGFFDGLIDSVFVVNADRGVLYCNEAAAKLCDSSVRRLAKGKPIFDFMEFSNKELFVMPGGTLGENEPAPYQELEFKLKTGKVGKIQVAIQPFQEPSGDKRWAVMIRDVTIEEVLHAKYHQQLKEKEVYIEELQKAQKQLEAYSKNLEHMVEERTREVKRANLMLAAIMNSLGQGFFVFDQNGDCLPFFTKACEDVLECLPSGKKVWDVLRITAAERTTFDMWMKAVYSEALPFESMRDLGPSQFAHSQGHRVKLEFFPIRDEAQKISNIVVVATDKTAEFLVNQALEREKKFARMVVKLITSRRQFADFLASCRDTIGEIETHLKTHAKPDHEWVYRVLHTLEGEASTYSIQEIWSAARNCQEALEPLKKGVATEINVVKNKVAEGLQAMRAEYDGFIESNRRLLEMLGVLEGDARIEFSRSEIEGLLNRLRATGLAPEFLDEISKQLLREPIHRALAHFQDVVQLVSEKLNKKMAPIKITGGDLRIYIDQYKGLFGSLIHAFRNAVDHGIEPSEEREMMGKTPEGHIEVFIQPVSRHGEHWFQIQIRDDGKGLSAETLRTKWMNQNSAHPRIATMSDSEVLQLVFASGFSTRSEVGEYSGRGVGMNVIKIEAEALGGKAWVESTQGQGTSVFVEVPDLGSAAAVARAA